MDLQLHHIEGILAQCWWKRSDPEYVRRVGRKELMADEVDGFMQWAEFATRTLRTDGVIDVPIEYSDALGRLTMPDCQARGSAPQMSAKLWACVLLAVDAIHGDRSCLAINDMVSTMAVGCQVLPKWEVGLCAAVLLEWGHRWPDVGEDRVLLVCGAEVVSACQHQCESADEARGEELREAIQVLHKQIADWDIAETDRVHRCLRVSRARAAHLESMWSKVGGEC